MSSFLTRESFGRNLPIAIFTSCILVTVVYTLTIIAFHSTLSVSEVLSAEAVAVVSKRARYLQYRRHSIEISDVCVCVDFCRETLRLDGVDCAGLCGSVHIWRREWHLVYLVKVCYYMSRLDNRQLAFH